VRIIGKFYPESQWVRSAQFGVATRLVLSAQVRWVRSRAFSFQGVLRPDGCHFGSPGFVSQDVTPAAPGSLPFWHSWVRFARRGRGDWVRSYADAGALGFLSHDRAGANGFDRAVGAVGGFVPHPPAAPTRGGFVSHAATPRSPAATRKDRPGMAVQECSIPCTRCPLKPPGPQHSTRQECTPP
jgi:hypothetical protein